MKKIALILLGLLVVGCTDADGARRVLEANGMKNIKITGYRFFACDGKSDQFSTGFEATTPTGSRVSGSVCSGWLKGSTVRFD